jgi:hypothetical protein
MEGKDIMVHVDLGEGNDLIRNNHIKVDDEFEDLYMNPIKLSEASEPPVPPVFIRTEQPPVNWQGYYESRMKWIVDRGLRKIDDIMDVSEVGKRRGMLRVEAPEVEEPVALEVVALTTTTAKVRELEEERGNILNVFDSTVHSMYQRFSSTDDTVYMLEAVTTAIRGVMEWHKVFSELHVGKAADIRNTAQQSLVGLCLAARCVIENVRHHVSVINQEYRGYEASFKQFHSPPLESNIRRFEKVRNLRDRYVEFLQRQPPNTITRASLELLQSQHDDKLLFSMRTIMVDVQKHLDAQKRRSAKAAHKEEIDDMEKLRADKSRLQKRMDDMNRKLLTQWSRANWKTVQQLQQDRDRLKEELEELERQMQTTAADASATAIHDFKNPHAGVSGAEEHRYQFLNNIVRMTEEFRRQAMETRSPSTQETYFRLNDVLEDETQLALCRLRNHSTEEIYSAGIDWAQKFSAQVAEITKQFQNMERFLRDQKRHLDDVLAQQKRRLIMRNASVADLDMSRLQSLAAQYATLCANYTKMRIAAEDTYAAQDLEKRLCPLK